MRKHNWGLAGGAIREGEGAGMPWGEWAASFSADGRVLYSDVLLRSGALRQDEYEKFAREFARGHSDMWRFAPGCRIGMRFMGTAARPALAITFWEQGSATRFCVMAGRDAFTLGTSTASYAKIDYMGLRGFLDAAYSSGAAKGALAKLAGLLAGQFPRGTAAGIVLKGGGADAEPRATLADFIRHASEGTEPGGGGGGASYAVDDGV